MPPRFNLQAQVETFGVDSLLPDWRPTKPRVINLRKGKIPGGVYVGRPTKWGNPFVIGKDGTRDQVVSKYATWLIKQPQLIESAQKELRGRDLCCWCAPLACHADVLLDIANVDFSKSGVDIPGSGR